MQLGHISKEDFEKIQNALSLFELPTQMDGFNAEKVLSATKSDKKMVGNQVKFILLKEIGNAYIYRELTDEQILDGIRYVCQNHSKKSFYRYFMLSHSDFFRPVYKISCSTAFERSDACCFVEKRFGTQLFREPWCSVWYFSGKTVAAYYFYRDCSDPYHIFLSDAHSFGKTFWLTQWVTLLTGLRRDMWLISFISD